MNMLLGGQQHGCVRGPARSWRIPAEPSLQARAVEALDLGHARAVLAKIGAYRCPPFTPPEQTRFEVSTVGKVVTQTADPGQLLKLPEGGGSPTWVTDGWTQGTQGLGEGLQQPAELLKQLQAQLPGVAAGDGGPSAAAKLQDTLAALKDSLAGAAASQEAQRQNIEKTFSSMSEMAGTSSPKDPHFGRAAIQDFVDSLSASAPKLSAPQPQLETLQASAHDVEKQVEAALQKLSSSLPQLPQSSEDLASRVKETGSGVHDLLAGGSSDLTTVLRDFWTQLEASLGGNEGMAGPGLVFVAAVSIGVAVLLAFSIPRRKDPQPLPSSEYGILEFGDYWAQRAVTVPVRSRVTNVNKEKETGAAK